MNYMKVLNYMFFLIILINLGNSDNNKYIIFSGRNINEVNSQFFSFLIKKIKKKSNLNLIINESIKIKEKEKNQYVHNNAVYRTERNSKSVTIIKTESICLNMYDIKNSYNIIQKKNKYILKISKINFNKIVNSINQRISQENKIIKEVETMLNQIIKKSEFFNKNKEKNYFFIEYNNLELKNKLNTIKILCERKTKLENKIENFFNKIIKMYELKRINSKKIKIIFNPEIYSKEKNFCINLYNFLINNLKNVKNNKNIITIIIKDLTIFNYGDSTKVRLKISIGKKEYQTPYFLGKKKYVSEELAKWIVTLLDYNNFN